jgi:hypothetical protein
MLAVGAALRRANLYVIREHHYHEQKRHIFYSDMQGERRGIVIFLGFAALLAAMGLALDGSGHTVWASLASTLVLIAVLVLAWSTDNAVAVNTNMRAFLEDSPWRFEHRQIILRARGDSPRGTRQLPAGAKQPLRSPEVMGWSQSTGTRGGHRVPAPGWGQGDCDPVRNLQHPQSPTPPRSGDSVGDDATI